METTISLFPPCLSWLLADTYPQQYNRHCVQAGELTTLGPSAERMERGLGDLGRMSLLGFHTCSHEGLRCCVFRSGGLMKLACIEATPRKDFWCLYFLVYESLAGQDGMVSGESKVHRDELEL